jgi:hypothetical protein
MQAVVDILRIDIDKLERIINLTKWFWLSNFLCYSVGIVWKKLVYTEKEE